MYIERPVGSVVTHIAVLEIYDNNYGMNMKSRDDKSDDLFVPKFFF